MRTRYVLASVIASGLLLVSWQVWTLAQQPAANDRRSVECPSGLA